MVYITGKQEKVEDLIKQEGFSEFFKNKDDFFQLNPHLILYKNALYLPTHSPIVLQKDFDLENYANELNGLLPDQKERLWLLQESQPHLV